jgi:lipopolysaccharide/colanic/teichoic acid biosynthesis glycosyltransferase
MKPLPRRRPPNIGVDAIDSRRADRRARKKLFDVLVICCLSPFIIILFAGAAGIAGVIAFGTGESMLFPQDRLGLDGRIFRMWKFRTLMTTRPGGEVTLVGDDRVAPMGNLLRKPHLDELPQLWNVFNGDMSLVGPRPEQPSLARKYTLESPEFARRLAVLPGITGWAQINCSYAGDLPETMIKLAYDLQYIERQTLALDASILARTLVVMVRCGGR